MISRKVTGVLAWTGLVIVVAVPSADALLSRFAPAETAVVAPGPAAAVKPAQTPVASTPAPKPAPVVAQTPAPAPVPMPAPAATPAAAPATVVAEQPAETPAAPADPVQDYLSSNKTLPSYITPAGKPAAAAQPAATVPVPAPSVATASPAEESQGASIPAAAPKPTAAAPKPRPQTTRPITEADLKGWKSGTLEDYLRQNGLLSTGSAAN